MIESDFDDNLILSEAASTSVLLVLWMQLRQTMETTLQIFLSV